jgi:hypothetical protein
LSILRESVPLSFGKARALSGEIDFESVRIAVDTIRVVVKEVRLVVIFEHFVFVDNSLGTTGLTPILGLNLLVVHDSSGD